MFKVKLPGGNIAYKHNLWDAEGYALEKIHQFDVAQIDVRVRGRWAPLGSVTLRKGLTVYPASHCINWVNCS